jgi:hypothetical protein
MSNATAMVASAPAPMWTITVFLLYKMINLLHWHMIGYHLSANSTSCSAASKSWQLSATRVECAATYLKKVRKCFE